MDVDTLFSDMLQDAEENFLVNNNDFQPFEKDIWIYDDKGLTESESYDYN